MQDLTLKFTAELDYSLIAPFNIDGKTYAAFLPKQDILILKVREIPNEDSLEFLSIEDKSEFETAREAFDRIVISEECEE